MAILVLAPGLLVSCGQATVLYCNHEYGYSVEVPKNWLIEEEESGQTVLLHPSHEQMEIAFNVYGEDMLSNLHSKVAVKFPDMEMSALELVVYGISMENKELGAEVKQIVWNERAITTFTYLKEENFTTWMKTCYIVDVGYFYMITFKALGYSDSEFQMYRNQVNEICRTIRISNSSVIKLPEGKTVFDF